MDLRVLVRYLSLVGAMVVLIAAFVFSGRGGRPDPVPTAENTRSLAELGITTTTTTLPVAERVASVPGGGYQGGGEVSTFCDHGNRIYVFDAEQRAGIAAVPDPTCPRPAP